MGTTQVTPENIHAYLKQHQEKELCRFVTVGSVDDGKSTLIGRLLHDTHGIYEDQLDAVKKATKQEGGEIDFSLFTDGLKAEREQGITIDVAYRYFSTENRKFIIADTPGHVQYTRNMATGASTANVAVILIDARLGVLQQSRRHAYIASLLGIPHLAVCVNKMDLEDYREEVFNKIRAEFTQFCSQLRFKEVKFIPMSAKMGHNVVHDEGKTPWYKGGTILEYLEQVPVRAGINESDFRYPIQYVLRPHLNYRGFSGTIASGSVKKGDTLMSLPSRKKSRVLAIDTFDGELSHAAAPMAVTIRLEDEIDSSRGDMLVKPDNLPDEVQRFDAKVVWMGEQAMDRARAYLIKHTSQLVRVDIEKVKFLVDLETLEEKPANRVELNDIAEITLSAHKTMFVDPYKDNSTTGAFIIIDPLTNNTVAAGMIEGPAVARGIESLRADVKLPESKVSLQERRQALGQKGGLVVLTGLPASGKSELAYALEKRLFDLKKLAVVMDPDDGRGRDVPLDGSAPLAAIEASRRATGAALVTILSFAMPLRADRAAIRESAGDEPFVEIHLSASLDECKKRDVRGSYGPNHVDPSYEKPQQADLLLDLSRLSAEEAAATLIGLLEKKGFLKP